MSSVRIKDGLVILDPLCHRLDFLPRWLCRIARWRQHAELHQTQHQQDARLGRRSGWEAGDERAAPRIAKPSVLPRPTLTTGKPV